MASKQVTSKMKLAMASSMAIDTHKTKIVQSVGDFLRPHLREGETLPDLTFLPELLTRAVDWATQTVTQADLKYAAEQSEDRDARRVRDERFDRLFDSMVALRQFMVLAIGPDAPARAELRGETARDPVALMRQAESVSKKLRTGTFEGSLPGAPFDAGAWADRLDTERTQLASAIEAVARELRETEGMQAEQYAALEHFDHHFTKINHFAKSLLMLAGEDLLAQKMSYTRDHSSSSTSSSPDSEPIDPPTPPAPNAG